MPAGIAEFTANSPARSDGKLEALGNFRLADHTLRTQHDRE